LKLDAARGTIRAVTACAQCGAELPPDARFCPSCAAPVESRPQPAGERKVATVLFADLVGSTELGGSQDPERTRVMLDRFYDSMATEIERAGGTVEKFVGDAVMAAFGAPAVHEDDAERALHVALAMQRRLGELFAGRLALRIGVNTGDVVVGAPREGSSFATGDAVNVCARLEQAAAPGEILVGERTVAAARGAFEFGEPETIEAKGKPDGVVCRKLVRALSLMRPRRVAGLEPVFVGREAEVERLEIAYERVARDGEPQLLTILGDAGVGKTRLLRELWQRLSGRSPQPLLRTGRCLSYGEGITFWPVVEAIPGAAQVVAEDLPAAETFSAVRKLVESLARDRPVVLVFDDVHWGEPTFLDLVEHVADWSRDAPILLACPERVCTACGRPRPS